MRLGAPGLAVVVGFAAACGEPPSMAGTAAWEVELPSSPSYRTLLEATGGLCNVGSARIDCFEPTTGVITWQRDRGASSVATVDGNGDLVLVTEDGDYFVIEKVDGATGEQRWEQRFGTPSIGRHVFDLDTTLSHDVVFSADVSGLVKDALDDGTYLAGSRVVYRLSGVDGSRLWRYPYPEAPVIRTATDGEDTVIISDDRLERRDAGGTSIASVPLAAPLFDAQAPVDRYGLDDSPGGPFRIVGDLAVGVSAPPHYLTAADKHDGTVRYQRDVSGTGHIEFFELYPSPDGVVVAGSFFGNVDLAPAGTEDGDDHFGGTPLQGTTWPTPFAVKIAPDGQVLWSRAIGPDSRAQVLWAFGVDHLGYVLAVTHQFSDPPQVVKLSAYGP